MDKADLAQELEARGDRAERHLKMRGETIIDGPMPEERNCVDCGLPLSKMRLHAVPRATRCVPCQCDFESLQHRGLA